MNKNKDFTINGITNNINIRKLKGREIFVLATLDLTHQVDYKSTVLNLDQLKQFQTIISKLIKEINNE